ncbi:MAG: hypothetical protein A2889_00970 [Nitrospinae bacterium RIFCSPLOWO2_01_FULL_39_10]|nr:MAG: hypothetical protein A2889_00970 [Nitrospinae bacterium RIFCSPLOWO2_01_FULL_39_10]
MVEVKIKIPEDIKDIIDETSETIYVEALKEVARKRMSYTQKRLRDLKKKIALYEARYSKSYEKFFKTVPDTLNGHDDWIEWSYIIKVANELSTKIEKLKLLIGK